MTRSVELSISARANKALETAGWCRDTLGIRGMAGISAINLAADLGDLARATLALVEAATPFADFAECLDPDCPHKVCRLNRALTEREA